MLVLNSKETCWAKVHTQREHLGTDGLIRHICLSKSATEKAGRFSVILQRKGLAHQVPLLKECIWWFYVRRGGPESPRALGIPVALKRGSCFSFLQIIIKTPNKPGTPCFSSETHPTDRKCPKMSFKPAPQCHPMQRTACREKQNQTHQA